MIWPMACEAGSGGWTTTSASCAARWGRCAPRCAPRSAPSATELGGEIAELRHTMNRFGAGIMVALAGVIAALLGVGGAILTRF